MTSFEVSARFAIVAVLCLMFLGVGWVAGVQVGYERIGTPAPVTKPVAGTGEVKTTKIIVRWAPPVAVEVLPPWAQRDPRDFWDLNDIHHILPAAQCTRDGVRQAHCGEDPV